MRDSDYREERPADLLAEMGYETEDLKPGKLARAAAWMFAFLIACSVITYFYVQWVFPKKPAPTIASQRRVPGTPNPLLQSNVTKITDMMSLRQNETKALTEPAVIDSQKGVYRIPIEMAIDITAQRGLPKTEPIEGQAPPARGGTNGR